MDPLTHEELDRIDARTERLVVLSISCSVWEGETPQEAGYPGQ